MPRSAAGFSSRPPAASKTGMSTDDSNANQRETLHNGFLSRYVFSTDHKIIGLNYLWLALFSVFLGMAMSLLMRIHLAWPEVHLPFLSSLGNLPDRFAALTTLHGSLMVFLVLTAAPQAGFGNYFLPLQIGAREMAFPTLNLLAFWLTVVSLFGMTATFFLSPQPAITLWIVSVAIFCAASLLNALNFSVTTIDLRAPGMTLPRLPLTVWAWFINAILGALIFSILLAACVCLLSDRLMGTHFFPALNFIAAQPGCSRGQLAQHFALSERQLQADLNVIRLEMGLPLVRRQGYRFLDHGGQGPPPLGLADAEMLGLALRQAAASGTIAPAAMRSLTDKLPALFPCHLRPFLMRALPHVADEGAARDEDDVLMVVVRAIESGSSLRLRYGAERNPALAR